MDQQGETAMDIALRKDLIDIQELIANPPASSAERTKLERRRQRLSVSPANLLSGTLANEREESARRQQHQQQHRSRHRSWRREAACSRACNCSQQQRRSHHKRGRRHHQRAHYHHQLGLSSDREDQAADSCRATGGPSRRAANSGGGTKYSSDIALNSVQRTRVARGEARGKTLASGLATKDLHALVESRRSQLKEESERKCGQLCGGAQLLERGPRHRPSSACALSSHIVADGAQDIHEACPPDALLGDQVPAESRAQERPKPTELNGGEERNLIIVGSGRRQRQAQPKVSSPSGSLRSQASRAARGTSGGGAASKLLVIWPRNVGSKRRATAAAPSSAVAATSQPSTGAKVSLLRWRNLVRKRTATKMAGSGAKPTQEGDQESVTSERQQDDGSQVAAAGGRRQQREMKEQAEGRAAGAPRQHSVAMRAQNGTKLVQTWPLAPLDDGTQLYAIPKKNSITLKAKQWRQQQVAIGSDGQQEPRTSAMGNEASGAASDEPRSSSSPIASSWDECVDLVVSISSDCKSPGSGGAKQLAESGRLVGVREGSSNAPTSSKGSLVDSIPGYSVVKRPALESSSSLLALGADQLQEVDGETSGACLCATAADATPAAATTYGSRPNGDSGLEQSGDNKTKFSTATEVLGAGDVTPTGGRQRPNSRQQSANSCPPAEETAAAATATATSQSSFLLENGAKNDSGHVKVLEGELKVPKSVLSVTSAELLKAQKDLAAAAAKVQRDRMARMLKYHADAYTAEADAKQSTAVDNLLTVKTNNDSEAFWFSDQTSQQQRDGSKQQQLKAPAAQQNNSTHRSGNNSVGMSDSSPSNNGADSDNSIQTTTGTATTNGSSGTGPHGEGESAKTIGREARKSGPLGGILSRIMLSSNGNGKRSSSSPASSTGNGREEPMKVARREAPSSEAVVKMEPAKKFNGSISSTSSTMSSSSPGGNSNNRSPLTVVNETEGEKPVASGAKLDQMGSRSRRPIVLSGSSEVPNGSHEPQPMAMGTMHSQGERFADNQRVFDARFAVNGLPRVSSHTNVQTTPSSGLTVMSSQQEADQLASQMQMRANLCNYHALSRSQMIPTKYSAHLPYALGRYSIHEHCDPASVQYGAANGYSAQAAYYMQAYHGARINNFHQAHQQQPLYTHGGRYANECIYIPQAYASSVDRLETKESAAGASEAARMSSHPNGQQVFGADNHAPYNRAPSTGFMRRHQNQAAGRPNSSLDSSLFSSATEAAPIRTTTTQNNETMEDNATIVDFNGQHGRLSSANHRSASKAETSQTSDLRHDSAASFNGQLQQQHTTPYERIHSDFAIEHNSIYASGHNESSSSISIPATHADSSSSGMTNNSSASQLTVLPATTNTDRCAPSNNCNHPKRDIRAGKLTRVSIGGKMTGEQETSRSIMRLIDRFQDGEEKEEDEEASAIVL